MGPAPARGRDSEVLAELRVAADLVERGCKLSLPYGEACDYDLIADYKGVLHRIGVRAVRSDGEKIVVRRPAAGAVDWLAVYDATGGRCYYVPSGLVGAPAMLHLRLTPARNGQQAGINDATDYLEPDLSRRPSAKQAQKLLKGLIEDVPTPG